MRPRTRNVLAAVAGLAVLAALVVYAGPAKVADALRRADLRLVLLALACYATFFALRGWRWALLLGPVGRRRFSTWTATHATAVGWLANNVLPMRAGEVTRAGIVAKREDVPFFAVASTIAVERVLDVAGLAVAASVSVLVLHNLLDLPTWAALGLKLAAVLPLLALALLAAAAYARPVVTRILERLSSPLPHKIREKGLATFGHLVDGAEPIVRRPTLLAGAFALTIAMTVAQASIYAFLLEAFLPTTPFAVALAGAPWFVLTFALSVTPGNVGTYEAAFAAIYASFGLPADALLATAVLTHLATFLSVVVLGSLGLVALGVRPGAVAAGAKQAAPEAP